MVRENLFQSCPAQLRGLHRVSDIAIFASAPGPAWIHEVRVGI